MKIKEEYLDGRNPSINEDDLNDIEKRVLIRLRESPRRERVPEHTRFGIEDYVILRRPQGSFLTAVFSNNLFESFMRADLRNREAMFHIATYIYNDVPAICHGGPENVKAWLNPGESEASS